VVLYYLPPLLPGQGWYEERITDEAVLAQADFNELVFNPVKAKGPIERFELILHVPDEFARVTLTAKTKTKDGRDVPDQLRGSQMPAARIEEIRRERDELRGFYTVGWTCLNGEFPEGIGFGVNISRPMAD
jgi:hypothetical protein